MGQLKGMKLCLIVGLVALAVLAIYLGSQRREGYLASGSLDQLDSLGSLASSYVPLENVEVSPENDFPTLLRGKALPVDREKAIGVVNRPMDRLEQLQGEALIPRTTDGVTPYNISVADQTAYLFLSQAPRVTEIKPLNADYSAATFIRGDIPIKYFPNVPLVTASQYGRDGWQGAGLFSDYGRALYNRYTGGSFLNQPLQVENGGTVMDYGQQ